MRMKNNKVSKSKFILYVFTDIFILQSKTYNLQQCLHADLWSSFSMLWLVCLWLSVQAEL